MKSLKKLVKKAIVKSMAKDNICLSHYCKKEKQKYKIEINSTGADYKMMFISECSDCDERLVFYCICDVYLNINGKLDYSIKQFYKVDDFVDMRV